MLLASGIAQVPLTPTIVKINDRRAEPLLVGIEMGMCIDRKSKSRPVTDSGMQLLDYRRAMLLLMADG